MAGFVRVGAVATVLVAAAVVVSGAVSSRSPADPRVPALQARVTALQGTVGQLTSRMQRDESVIECNWANQQSIDIDFLDLFALITGNTPYSGPAPTDNGACAAIGATFTPPSVAYSLRAPGSTPSSAAILGRLAATIAAATARR